MPRVNDLTRVRAMLDRDRTWAAYAIGDLAPDLVINCEWHAPADGTPALVMLYRGFDPPIAFAMGDAGALAGLFRELDAPTISLHVQPHALDALTISFAPTFTRQMVRMRLLPPAFRPAEHDDVRPIADGDLAALTALYDDGHARGEGPAFFTPAMVAQGTFQGVWEGDALVAVAGTHLYSPTLGVCTIGNVYTRSDRRGRGLAARVTTAVVARALADRIPTVVLNVGRANTAAQRVYERLGFDVYCEFLEGEALKIES